MPQHVGDARDAVTESTVQPAAHGIVVRHGPIAHLARELAVDVLEMHVPHANSGDSRDFERVGPAKREVPGVQTERVAALVEEVHHVMPPLDDRAEVRVHGHLEPPPVGDLGDGVESVEERAPLVIRDIAGPRVAGATGGGGENEDVRTHGAKPLRVALDRSDLRGTPRRLVQDRRHESTDEAKTVRVEKRARGAGVGRKKPGRTGLCRGEAELAHFGENAGRLELDTPPRDFADAPRDRRSGELHLRQGVSQSRVARVKIAILGVGRLGAFHAKVLKALPEVSELRVTDADSARAATVAREIGATHAPTVDAALEGADAAVIVTPTGTHTDLILRALDRGMAVFCEKPIALDLESTKRVVDQVEKTNARVQIGFQRRFDAGFQEARRRVQTGALGTVYSFHMTSRDALPPPDAYIQSSGGQFIDQLIHDFDVTRWMFADEVDEIYATGSTLGYPQYAQWGDVATSAAIVKLRRGTVGLLEAARHNEAGYDIRVEVYGAKDTIAVGLDPRTPLASVERDAPKFKSPAYPTFFVRFDGAYRAELAHFLRFARGEAENPCTVRDGMEALRLGLAAGVSLRDHRPVALDEIR